MKRILYVILFIACAGVVRADDVKKPDLQIADNSFFDPTRKEEPVEQYRFGVEYRIEAGYVQHNQWSKGTEDGDIMYPDMYLHGARIGATFTFKLPMHFGLQTGVLYTLVAGRTEQHWRSMDAMSTQTEYIRHNILEHNLTVPLRVFYVIPLWKELRLFFYTGPQLHIGLAQQDNTTTHLSAETEIWLREQQIHVDSYDRMADELWRANIQYGLGGGLEWDRYRLQSGYDFGLNNLVRNKLTKDQHMWEWGWYVSFSYRL